MALYAFLKDLNGVDDALKSFYTQSDSGYVLNVTPTEGYALENVDGLKSALGKERERAEKLEKKNKRFSSLDYDEVVSALDKVKMYESFDPKSEADKLAQEKFKSLEEQIKQKHREEKDQLLSKLNNISSQFERATVESEAIAELAKQNGNVKLLLPHIKASIKTSINDDGTFTYSVVDSSGTPRIGDSQGSPMTISQLIGEMKNSDVYSLAFKGTGSSGGGTPPNIRGNGGTPPSQTATDKIASGIAAL